MIEPAPTSPSRGGGERGTQRKGARATNPTLSVQERRNCRWHSEGRNGTPRRSGVIFLGYLFASALARIRCTPARERGVEMCMTGSSGRAAATARSDSVAS